MNKKVNPLRDQQLRSTEEIGRLISRLYRLQYEQVGLALKSLQLTALHSTVLVNIYRYPQLNQNQLAEVLCIDKATVSRILRVLEERGLVQRVPFEKDRRLSHIGLTTSGMEIVKQSMARQEQIWEMILEGVSQEQRQQMQKTLQIMFNNINHSEYN